jgi:folylpolyglutamate synthase/dihydropteroate synthase
MTSDGSYLFTSIADALDHVLSHVEACDRVIIAGSFYTVAAALSYFGQ